MDKIHIEVKGRRLLVLPDPLQEVSEGGIILQYDKKLERAAQSTGTLVKIGDLAWTGFDKDLQWAEVGDWVLYSKYAGKLVTDPVTNIDYMVLNDEDLIAVLTRE